jgi:vacuolar-type H+-ATPase subunit D/Vma8
MNDKEKLKLFTSIINLLRAHRDNISPEIVDIILAAVEERPTDG